MVDCFPFDPVRSKRQSVAIDQIRNSLKAL